MCYDWCPLLITRRWDLASRQQLDATRERWLQQGWRFNSVTLPDTSIRAGVVHGRLSRLTDPKPRRPSRADPKLPRPLPGTRCVYCPHPATTMDHVVPYILGGGAEPDNLVPACKPCNSRRGAAPLKEWLPWPRCVVCDRRVFDTSCYGCSSTEACSSAALDPALWEFVAWPLPLRGGVWTRRDDPRRRVYDLAGKPDLTWTVDTPPIDL